MASGGDSKTFSNVSTNQGPFTLNGGVYAVTVRAGTWGGGSVTLQTLAADASTWIAVLPAFTADGYATVSLPPGQCRFAVATAAGVYASLARVNQ